MSEVPWPDPDHAEIRRYLRELGGGRGRSARACSMLLRMPRTPTTHAPKTEAWFRRLDGGRLEIFLKLDRPADQGDDYKIRASGPEDDMFELVDFFERHTGMRVDSPEWRKIYKGSRPMVGQETMDFGEATDGELS